MHTGVFLLVSSISMNFEIWGIRSPRRPITSSLETPDEALHSSVSFKHRLKAAHILRISKHFLRGSKCELFRVSRALSKQDLFNQVVHDQPNCGLPRRHPSGLRAGQDAKRK